MPVPVEIRELHIRVAVGAPPAKPAGGPAKPTANGGAADKDAIVAACVEQVLDIVRSGKER